VRRSLSAADSATAVALQVAAPRRLERLRLSPYAVWLVAITVLALLIRVVVLGHQPLAGDEAFTALVSRRSWLDMFAVVRSDSGAPLPYVLSHLATSVSTDPGALRFPSALAGTAAVPLLAALARRLADNRAALCAALAAAVLPPLVASSRDGRMYALAGTLVLAMALTLWRAAEQPTRARLATHALVVAAAVLSDYFALFAVVASLLGAWLVLRCDRRTLLRLALASGAGCAALALWLPFATAQFRHAGQPFWLDGMSPGGRIGGVLSGFLGGPPVDPGLPWHISGVILQGLAITGAGTATLAVLFPLPWDAPWRRRRLAFVAMCGLGAAVLIALVSVKQPLLDARYVSVVWTPLFAVVGLGVARFGRFAVLPLLGMAAFSTALIALPTRADVAAAVHHSLSGRVAAEDLVLASPDTYLLVLAGAGPDVVSRTHVDTTSLPWYFGTAAYPRDAFFAGVPAGTGRIDVVTLGYEAQPSVLGGAVRRLGQQCGDMVCVTVYAPGG
jgi:Dolichyl-phosphate-mannose-protein mannosyltransferase